MLTGVTKHTSYDTMDVTVNDDSSTVQLVVGYDACMRHSLTAGVCLHSLHSLTALQPFSAEPANACVSQS